MRPVLALRFRDLVTPPGDTMKQHAALVAEHGYCWWAWWKKGAEQLPADMWVELNAAARKAPLDVLLLDSGNNQLHTARLTRIAFDPSGAPMPAPEGGARTPAYYKDTPFSSWMQLSELRPVEPAHIRSYAWLAFPRHLALSPEVTAAFEGRRVHNVDELVQFNATWWLLRPRTAKDRENQVVLAAPRQPGLLSREVVDCPGNALLHLSDPHLSLEHHAFPLRDQRDVRETLAGAIDGALRHRRDLRIGAVVVTGDLTWRGAPEEFALFESELVELLRLLGLEARHCLIVPGNHDLAWEPAGGSLYSVASDAAKANYRSFLGRFFGSPVHDTLAVCRRMVFSTATVEMVGVNSCAARQQEGVFAGVGFIGRGMYPAAEALGWKEGRSSRWRLAALHHHVTPVVGMERFEDAARGFGMAADAEGFVRQALEWGVDVVLHGHQHQPFFGTVTRTSISGAPLPERALAVVGGGSCGVKNAELGPIRQRTFGVLEFCNDGDGDSLKYHLFKTGERSDTEFTWDAAYRLRNAHAWARCPAAP